MKILIIEVKVYATYRNIDKGQLNANKEMR